MTDKVAPFDIDAAPAPEDGAREDGWPAIVFAGLLLLVGLVFLVQTFAIRSQAAVWPRGLAALLVALSAAQAGRLLLRRLRAPRDEAAPPPEGDGATAAARRAFTALWLLVYCVAAQWTGFGPAMVVMMPLYMWLMGYRRPILVVLITAGAAAAMTYVFDMVAYVPVWEVGL